MCPVFHISVSNSNVSQPSNLFSSYSSSAFYFALFYIDLGSIQDRGKTLSHIQQSLLIICLSGSFGFRFPLKVFLASSFPIVRLFSQLILLIVYTLSEHRRNIALAHSLTQFLIDLVITNKCVLTFRKVILVIAIRRVMSRLGSSWSVII